MKKDSNKPIRVGVVMGKMLGGGVESVIMNYYRHIDRSKVQFDFICDDDSTNIPKDEIESLGGNVILCPPYQKVFKYIKFLKKLFKDNSYKIVHSNINTLSVFPLYAAKKACVPVRIAHSHSTSNKKEWGKNLIKNILKPFSKKYANIYFACTEHAAKYQFGNKIVNDGKVIIINNAIDLNNFKLDEKIRNEKRKELKINDDTLVIGHIGRFIPQKNHMFLIDIFNELHNEKSNSILLLIGQGPLVAETKDKVNNLKLTDSVMFLGQREDVNDLYQAMDAFALPSLYEGLGMVLIEAQASGLPCFASSVVPDVAKINSNFFYLNLNDSAEDWAKAIINNVKREDSNESQKKLVKSNYSIADEAKKLQDIYISLYKKVVDAHEKNCNIDLVK